LEQTVSRLLVTLAFLVAVAGDVSAQVLLADAKRDRPLYTSVLAFLNDTITINQLEADLREYARAFEEKPYKVGRSPIEWMKFPQERLFALLRVIATITGPAHEAFTKGELTAAQTAVKVAPFFLIWEGYGIDPPTDDALSRVRADELMDEIQVYSGPAINLTFVHVAEGYASFQQGRGVRVAPRMFSAPDNVCASAPSPSSLYSPADQAELHVGQPFPIGRLVIEARDETGRLLPGVPIAIEVEAVEPPVLNTQSNAMPENHLHPVRPGTFRVRVRTICSETPIQVLIPAVIR
jgi:hypothetical protein